MPVQITQIPNFQGQPINAPGMSANNPGAQALGNLAQSIAGVSEAFAGHAQQIQKIENARIISENRQNLAKSYAEFQIENQKEPDPQTRIAKTDAFLSSQKAKFDQPSFSPYVKATLTDHYDEFATRAFISSREDAANLSAKRAGLALSNEIQAAKRTRDRSLFESAKSTGREAGILLPEQEQALDMDFDQNIQFESARLQAEDYPKEAIVTLEAEDFLTTNPALLPEDREKLLRYAKQQVEVKRANEIDLFETALIENKLDISHIVNAEYLTAKDRQAFGESLKKAQGQTPITQQEYLNAWKVTDALRTSRLDPKISDDSYRLIHNEARTDILNRVPPSYQGDLKKELGYLSPAGRDTTKSIKPIDKNADLSELKAIARAQITRAHNSSMYADVGKDSTFESREKAARKAEDSRIQANRFIESKNPPPQPEEIRAYVDTLNGTAIDGDTPLIPSLPAPFAFPPDIDSDFENLLLPPR